MDVKTKILKYYNGNVTIRVILSYNGYNILFDKQFITKDLLYNIKKLQIGFLMYIIDTKNATAHSKAIINRTYRKLRFNEQFNVNSIIQELIPINCDLSNYSKNKNDIKRLHDTLNKINVFLQNYITNENFCQDVIHIIGL